MNELDDLKEEAGLSIEELKKKYGVAAMPPPTLDDEEEEEGDEVRVL